MEKKYTLYRILLYIFIIAVNTYCIYSCYLTVHKKYRIVKGQTRTYDIRISPAIWNLVFHIINAVVGLICELSCLMKQERLVPDAIKNFRHNFFNSVVFPMSITVSLLSWSVNFYDETLLFPKKDTNVVLTRFDDHITHTLIVPVVLWELMLQPKMRVSHKNNCLKLFFVLFIYNCVLFYARYYVYGYWAYDVVTALEGTYAFYGFFLTNILFYFTCYYVQWYIKDLISIHKETPSKND